jgi:urease accessory protein
VIGGVRVRVEDGRVVHLSCQPPVGAKVLPGPELLLVGTAAGLLEGDVVTIDVTVGAGSHLTVRSTAATLAHPCPRGGWTQLDVRAHVGPGASLHWRPEPLVACGGGRHRGESRIVLDSGATAVWREVVCLGRTGEAAGVVETRVTADLDGHPLLRDGLRVHPSPAVLGPARHVGAVHVLGRRSEIAGGMQLHGPGTTVRALAADAATLENLLSRKEELVHV